MTAHQSKIVNRTLPKHITAHPDGWLVRITRGAIKLQAFVAYGLDPRPSTLARAIATRDRFLIQLGTRIVRSNTGEMGITETVKWVSNCPQYCFNVYLGKHRKPMMKRIYYGRPRSRDEALRQAIALRAKIIPHSELRIPHSEEVQNG